MRVGLALGLDEETIDSCQRRYGTAIERVFETIEAQPGLGRRVVSDLPFCMAEVVHAVIGEMAQTLEDVLRRRIPLTLLSRLDEATVQGVAAVVGDLLNWSEQRRRDEVAAVMLGSAPSNVHETA